MYVGERETKWLFVILFTSQFLTREFCTFVRFGGSAATFSSLLCCVVPFAVIFAAEKMSGGFSGGFSKALGKCYGKCALLVEAAIFVLAVSNAAVRLNLFAAALAENVYPDTPVSYLTVFFVFAMLCVCFLGLQNITRYAYLVGAGVAAVFALVLCMAALHFDFKNIFPIFGNGALSVANGVTSAQAFADVLYLYFLGGFFKKGGAVFRVGIKSAAISAVMIVLFTLSYALCVPYPASAGYKYPFFRLASLANTSVLFQRLDGAVYIVWIFSGFVCTGALALFCSKIFSDCFKCSDYRGNAPLVVLIISALSLCSFGFVKILSNAFAPFTIAVIIITALVYRLRGGKV